jgi:hypothetical protein
MDSSTLPIDCVDGPMFLQNTDGSLTQLVASSTVGAAATGCVFAHPQHPTHLRPTSHKRKATELWGLSSPTSRPATSAAHTPNGEVHRSIFDSSPFPSSEERPPTSRKRPLTALQIDSSRASRILSSARGTPPLAADPESAVEERKEPHSNRSSWYKRLSSRPLSQSGSPRSSVGPDSPSLTFSHGSSAPILSSDGNTSQLPPNKLVKRATSGRDVDIKTLSRNGSRSQAPTLRRPATSHQRSATLQQRFKLDENADPKRPMTHHDSSASSIQHTPPPAVLPSPLPRPRWRLHFESRPTRNMRERALGRSTSRFPDGVDQKTVAGQLRILPDSTVQPTLVNAAMITHEIMETSFEYYYDKSSPTSTTAGGTPLTAESGFASIDDESEESHKRPRRSLSMHFSSPTTWVARSSSLRAAKRDAARKNSTKRNLSAPTATSIDANLQSSSVESGRRQIDGSLDQEAQRTSTSRAEGPSGPLALTSTRNRNNSSPLPPISRLSNYGGDLARAGMTSPPTTQQALSNPRIISTGSKSYRTFEDRASTLLGSDNDIRGFLSGDDDDLDFQSDTVFDSFRTAATSNPRHSRPSLENMFDDIPPHNGPKVKIAALQDLMALGSFGGDTSRITEEDEDLPTPIKNGKLSHEKNGLTAMADDLSSSPPSFALATKEFGRLSIEDEDEDEDWTKEDDDYMMNSPLSPPTSSLSSSRVSPAFRAALADLTNGGSSACNAAPPHVRPKSNVFDWSEPSTVERDDIVGHGARPKTAHVKQLADNRDGRAVGRRAPSALHVRSQSVPVVPDMISARDGSKLTSKFGTWGLGAKGVSEDWDNDFEFDGTDDEQSGESDNKKRPESLIMHVPPAIQASQANVVGHVGQIREVCLLVEDLKRLRGLAREKGLLYSSSASLWKEAEGIIALAIPDEDDFTLSPPDSPASSKIDLNSVDDNYKDWGMDAEDVSRPERPIEVLDDQGRPTGYMYNGKDVRRRSVFSPEDDIFGSTIADDVRPNTSHEEPRTSSTFPRPSTRDSAAIARSVMENMHQHRATSDPLLSSTPTKSSSKMPFDTTSLRDLVNRASVLSRQLAEIIRNHDRLSQSPTCSPKRDRDTSPAFTRVFTDPLTIPPKPLPRSQSNNSMLTGSLDSSPSRSLGQRMHMMTVV